VVQIIWVIVVLIVVLMIERMLLPGIGMMRIGGGMPPFADSQRSCLAKLNWPKSV
jgi:hypothetical protein